MTVVKRHYVDGPFGQMHLRCANRAGGAQVPLLCIHMSPMTGRVFERFLGEIGQDRTAVAFDTPGYGQSDAPPAPPEIEDYARALLAGLGAFGIEGPLDVMGYHTGGKTAAALANMAPARVRRLVIIGAAILSDPERADFSGYYGAKPIDVEGSHILRRWRGFVYHNLRPGVTIDDVADAFREAMTGGSNEWWGHRAAFRFDFATELKWLRQTALIMNLGDDLDVQTRRADGLAPHSRIVELPGWGHGFLDHHRQDAARLVRSFLDAAEGQEFGSLDIPASALAPRYPAGATTFAPVK